MKKKLAKALLYLMTGGLAFFVVTFTVYFFNLDMKLTSMIEPLQTNKKQPADNDPAGCFAGKKIF